MNRARRRSETQPGGNVRWAERISPEELQRTLDGLEAEEAAAENAAQTAMPGGYQVSLPVDGNRSSSPNVPAGVNSPPLPADNSPDSLGDLLAREDGRLFLNYNRAHDRNVRKLIDDIFQSPPNADPSDIEARKRYLLQISLDYYAQEYAQLKKLEEESVLFSDYAKQLIAQRRSQVQSALRKAGILNPPQKK
jgi:hypothetical protein